MKSHGTAVEAAVDVRGPSSGSRYRWAEGSPQVHTARRTAPSSHSVAIFDQQRSEAKERDALSYTRLAERRNQNWRTRLLRYVINTNREMSWAKRLLSRLVLGWNPCIFTAKPSIHLLRVVPPIFQYRMCPYLNKICQISRIRNFFPTFICLYI